MLQTARALALVAPLSLGACAPVLYMAPAETYRHCVTERVDGALEATRRCETRTRTDSRQMVRVPPPLLQIPLP